MKKILTSFLLISFLGVLVLPLTASAQDKPIDCCKLNRNIRVDDVTYAKGIYVGETSCSGITADCSASAGETQSSNCATSKWGVICLLNTLYNVTDWIFFILLGVAAIYVIIGAMNLLMSAGDPAKVTSGRNYIMYALIGLILALLARTIPAIAKLVVGS
ncbi:MAG: hypothetical protein ABIG08_01700 [bacterium]